MDVGEMVEQLLEKKLSDYINSNLTRGTYTSGDIDRWASHIVSEQLQKKFEEMKPQLQKAAEEFVDSCEVDVGIDNYGRFRIELKEPDHD